MDTDIIGKLLLLSYFIFILMKKITNFNGFIEELTSNNYSDPTRLGLGITIFLSFGVLLTLCSDYKNRKYSFIKVKKKTGRLGIIILLIYIIVNTYNNHNIFVNINNIDLFVLNLSIIGGLIMLLELYIQD